MFVDKKKAKRIMLENDILVKDISKKLGISRQRVWEIMGKVNVREETVERLASVLHCDPKEIVKGGE